MQFLTKKWWTKEDFYEAIPYEPEYKPILEIFDDMRKSGLYCSIGASGSVYPYLVEWENKGFVISRWKEKENVDLGKRPDGSPITRREYAKKCNAPRVLERIVSENTVPGKIIPNPV